MASSNLLPVLGIAPSVGRNFTESEDRGAGAAVALISDRLWRRRFHRDPMIVGHSIKLDGEQYTIVGILPSGMQMPEWADIWIPLSRMDPHAFGARQMHVLAGLGRLKPGVTLERAQDDIQTIVERLRREYPVTNGPTTFEMRTLQLEITGQIRAPLIAVSCAVALIFLIATANIANLLLTRLAGRQKELATRRALGAGNPALIMHVVTESLLLSIAGAIVGVIFAAAGLSWIRHSNLTIFSNPQGIALEWHAGVFAAFLAIFATAISVIGPAVNIFHSADSGHDGLRTNTMGRSQRRWQFSFVVAQVAIAVAVSIGAGLLVKTFRFLTQSDLGFQAEHVVSFPIALSPATYNTEARARDYYQRLLPRIRSLPGVIDVGAVNTPPLSPRANTAARFFVDVLPDPSAGQFPVAQIRIVTPGYFRTMGISIHHGRFLDDGDENTMGVVVNQTLSRRFFQSSTAVGHNIVMGLLGPRRYTRPIQGVIADVKDTAVSDESRPTIYMIGWPAEATVLVRSALDPASLMPTIRREATAVDPGQAVGNVETMRHVITSSLSSQRLSTAVFSLLSVIALALAVIGIYGVVADQTERRIPELGIRIALGASPARICREVIERAGSPVIFGILGGFCLSFALNRFIRSMIFGVALLDTPTYIAISVLMASVSLCAVAIPALQAARVDPAANLRSQ
jgi:putative ABC transport system permease protein